MTHRLEIRFENIVELQVELRDHVPVTDLRGIQIGFMKFALIPCADSQGHELQEENLINSSNQLIGRNLFFKFNIISCRNLPPRFRVCSS